MTKKEFINKLDEAIEKGQGIEVDITLPGLSEPETIFNPKENVKYKKDYYNKAYNDDLVNNNCKDIKIVGITLID